MKKRYLTPSWSLVGELRSCMPHGTARPPPKKAKTHYRHQDIEKVLLSSIWESCKKIYVSIQCKQCSQLLYLTSPSKSQEKVSLILLQPEWALKCLLDLVLNEFRLFQNFKNIFRVGRFLITKDISKNGLLVLKVIPKQSLKHFPRSWKKLVYDMLSNA